MILYIKYIFRLVPADIESMDVYVDGEKTEAFVSKHLILYRSA